MNGDPLTWPPMGLGPNEMPRFLKQVLPVYEYEPLKGEPTRIHYYSVSPPDSVYLFVRHTLPILLNAPPPPVKKSRKQRRKQ